MVDRDYRTIRPRGFGNDSLMDALNRANKALDEASAAEEEGQDDSAEEETE